VVSRKSRLSKAASSSERTKRCSFSCRAKFRPAPYGGAFSRALDLRVVDLPTPITIYIAAENSGDAEALAKCFAKGAVVRDEGKTIEGLPAIKQWKAETKKKYQHTVEPLTVAQEDGKVIVTNRLTGNFPGSPIELEFVFTLEGDKIASLEIRS
jgi:hypothetical protein